MIIAVIALGLLAGGSGLLLGFAAIRFKAVSYTHLDVYKRQHFNTA